MYVKLTPEVAAMREKNKRYGCTYCVHHKTCLPFGACRYAAILDKYSCYGEYDRAIQQDLKALINGLEE